MRKGKGALWFFFVVFRFRTEEGKVFGVGVVLILVVVLGLGGVCEVEVYEFLKSIGEKGDMLVSVVV